MSKEIPCKGCILFPICKTKVLNDKLKAPVYSDPWVIIHLLNKNCIVFAKYYLRTLYVHVLKDIYNVY